MNSVFFIQSNLLRSLFKKNTFVIEISFFSALIDLIEKANSVLVRQPIVTWYNKATVQQASISENNL